ncbi:MAG: helix-turn-helix transcriptional regulator [Proteobacteria bacterium]|nr:helix-turn-helix transcriptional regulator [Pseudomonadota bacterium]
MPVERLDKTKMELRRGALVLAVLAALRQEFYAYALRKRLSDAGLEVDEGTLYPLVRRLEDYGLLVSEWRRHEGRKRRYYKASAEGLKLFGELKAEWANIDRSLTKLIKG